MAWCTFHSSDYTRRQLLLYFLFYGELWISIIIIIITSILVSKHLKDEARKSSLRKFRAKLKYFPLLVIILWLMPSIDTLTSYRKQHKSDMAQVFAYLHAIALSLQGFANFMLYGYGFIKKIILEKFRTFSRSFIQIQNRDAQETYTRLLTENEIKGAEMEEESRNHSECVEN